MRIYRFRGTNVVRIGIGLYVCLSLLACKQKEAAETTKPSAVPATAAAVPAAPIPVGGQEYKNDEGAFKLTLFAGATVPAPRKAGSMTILDIESDNSAAVTVRWTTPAAWDSDLASVKALATPNAGDTAVGSGPFGNGYYYHNKFASGIHQAEYIIKTSKATVFCRANVADDAIAISKAACATLAPL